MPSPLLPVTLVLVTTILELSRTCRPSSALPLIAVPLSRRAFDCWETLMPCRVLLRICMLKVPTLLANRTCEFRMTRMPWSRNRACLRIWVHDGQTTIDGVDLTEDKPLLSCLWSLIWRVGTYGNDKVTVGTGGSLPCLALGAARRC